MFTLKIHTVDFPEPLHTTLTSTASAAPNANTNLKPAQLMGVAHLFRQLPSASVPAVTVANISARTTLVFVVAVPNYLSSDDFLLFCGNHVPHFEEILFLRNDGMEDRYSVLIRLESQLAADGFYCSYNGKRFKPSEVEVCHIYFAQAVEYTESAEVASIPPPDYTELPSCPVCLERLDPDTSGIQSTLCDHSFHCSCVSKWTYLSCPVCRLCQEQDERPVCAVCGTLKNLWICLICGFVGCGRYEKGHASGHWSDKKHHFSLELEKQQIWDYVGDRYVHRLNQSKVDGKSVIVSSRCSSVEECGTCGCDEGEGLDGALFSSKIEGILDEYNRLLASQLDIQRQVDIFLQAIDVKMVKLDAQVVRDQQLVSFNFLYFYLTVCQHYESLLAEEKSRKESSTAKAVEKAIFSRTHDLEDKLEKYAEEKKAVADRNQELMKKQEFLQNNFKEIEERLRLGLKSKDEKILDLQEQTLPPFALIGSVRTPYNFHPTFFCCSSPETVIKGSHLAIVESDGFGLFFLLSRHSVSLSVRLSSLAICVIVCFVLLLAKDVSFGRCWLVLMRNFGFELNFHVGFMFHEKPKWADIEKGRCLFFSSTYLSYVYGTALTETPLSALHGLSCHKRQFNGLQCGNMHSLNGLESCKQPSAKVGVSINACLKAKSALFSGEGDLSDYVVLSADMAPTTSGIPVGNDEFDLDLPSEGFSSIPEAIEDIYNGKMVVVVDDEDRENEGDLIMAASKVTAEAMAFFVKHGTGIVCVSMKGEDLERLELPLMVSQKENEEKLCTAFTVSVYREGGVLKRAGHTEAAVDLAMLAGLEHAGVLCEIVDDDGSMARLPKLLQFAQKENLKIVSIADLIRYRWKRNRLVEHASAARIPTMWGPFTAYCYRSILDGIEHIAMVKGDIGDGLDILVRVHSECLTGDIFGSARCDCGNQLALAMQQIEAAGRGVLIYLRGHEGRGIGLGHKLRAYNLQDDGHDTVEANEELGLPVDSREYGIGAQILRDLGVRTMKLMTNNPAKYVGLKGYGLAVAGRVPLVTPITKENKRYLETKHSKMGHVYGVDVNGHPASHHQQK
ncbi:Bifunctional riboflavin biosynthesis protein RIBA 1, chloroplastic [Sesamum angolense]|uniref:GTP cyclohydrolase II n=1 Tax=Sesamum angolense TaxID=2727404 RepID=A0AAE1X5B5_9LAMI|nr:Bifunctional riboflavin biosynthesis protein RIBA 1, chloroplastic [Sesamum angolense]